jgi:hypothetical protein
MPMAATESTAYAEAAPGNLQAVYFVVAVDAQGRRSLPSNFVGGPSYAQPETLATMSAALHRVGKQGSDAALVASAQARIATVKATLERDGTRRSRELVLQEVARVDAWMRAHPGRKSAAVDVRRLLVDVADTLRFVDSGQYPATVARQDTTTLTLTDAPRPQTVAAPATATN